jgi:hypothetical protein
MGATATWEGLESVVENVPPLSEPGQQPFRLDFPALLQQEKT